MANGPDTVVTTVKIRPELDEQAAAKAIKNLELSIKNASELYKHLSKVKVEWEGVTKQASLNIKNIRNLSSAADYFGKALSGAAKDSFKALSDMGANLDKLVQQAEGLQTQMKAAKTASARKALSAQLTEVTKKISGLNKEITDHQKANRKYGKELKGTMHELTKFKDFKPGDAAKQIFGAIGSGLQRGGAKGLFQALKGTVGGAAKGVAGASARGVASGAGVGALAKIIPMIAKIAGPLAIAAAAAAAFFKVIAGASQQTAELNKTLLAGSGTAKDFVSSSDTYRGVIDEMRDSVLDSSYAMLKYGFNAKKTSEVLNAFTQSATGSLIATRNTMAELGSGSVKLGMQSFVQSAIAYGKALGMEAKDVASLMGDLVSDVGYGAQNIQDALGGVVQAAATANMPMTKFMNLFRQVLPDVELYRNRLEELTGTISLLSKTMNPADVKKFMDAFRKGFKGTDFKQRLKTVFLAGPEYVEKTLGHGFQMGAKNIAKQLDAQVGKGWGDKFMKTYTKGTGAVAELMAEAETELSKQGKALTGGLQTQAMELAEGERARKGGVLEKASALRQAGMSPTYLILNKMSQKFGKGFSGLIDHIQSQTGISEEQKEMLRKTAGSLATHQAMLRKTGMTTDKYLNEGLVKSIAMIRKIDEGNVTMEMLQHASQEEIIYAAEYAQQQRDAGKIEITAKSLAQEQVDATLDLLDKVDNVLGYILEQIYKVLDNVIGKAISGIWNWITGSDAEKKQQQKVIQQEKKRMAEWEGRDVSKESKRAYAMVSEATIAQAQKGQMGGAAMGRAAGAQWEKIFGGEAVAKMYGKGGIGGGFQTNQLQKWLLQTGSVKGVAPEMRTRKGAGGETVSEYVPGTGQSKEAVALATAEELTKAFQAQDWGKVGELLEPIAEAQGRTTADVLQGFTQDMVKEIPEYAAGFGADTSMRRAGGTRKLSDKQKNEAAEAAGIIPVSALAPGAGKETASSYLAKAHKAKPSTFKEKLRPVFPGAPGAPAAAAGGGPAETPEVQATQEQTEAIVETDTDNTDLVVEAVDDTGAEVADVAGLMRSGLILEDSFMSGTFKKTVAEATLESLRTALLEHAIMIVKSMKETSEFGTFLAGKGEQILEKASMEKLAGAPTGAGIGPWAEENLGIIHKVEKKEEMQGGGTIPQAGMYKLHRGERVLSAAETAAYERGGAGAGGNSYTLIINGANMSVQEMKSVAVSTYEDMIRRSS